MLLKIDVESHELHAIGARAGVHRRRPAHGGLRAGARRRRHHGWSQEDSIALLRRAGDVEFEAVSETDGRTGQVDVVARPVQPS